MKNEDLVMDLLEKNGLDKRFRDNPEAKKQISSILLKEVQDKNGINIEDIPGYQLEENLNKIIDQFGKNDYVSDDGIRYNNSFTINEDGSFNMKSKTNFQKSPFINGKDTRTDIEKNFAIGKEKGDFIVSESNDYFSQTQDSTYAKADLKFSIFNKHGLEVQKREMSQDVSVHSAIGIRNSKEAFDSTINSTKRGHIYETTIERNSDLATEQYTKEEVSSWQPLINSRKTIIEENKNKDAISNPLPLYMSWSSVDKFDRQMGTKPIYPPEQGKNYLSDYNQRDTEIYGNQSEYERKEAVKNVYDILSNNTAFRDTLFENSKNNPKLKQVIENLNLLEVTNEQDEQLLNNLGTGKISDLETLYKNANSQELKETLQSIVENSKETDLENKTETLNNEGKNKIDTNTIGKSTINESTEDKEKAQKNVDFDIQAYIEQTLNNGISKD